MQESGSGKIYLMCKGADSTMLKLVKSDAGAVADVQKSLLDLRYTPLYNHLCSKTYHSSVSLVRRSIMPNTKHHPPSLLDISHMGLRTLCVAHKELTQAEADAWLDRYHGAASSMKGRAVKMACAAGEIERDMTLLGVTAIEVHSPRVKLTTPLPVPLYNA